MAKKRSFSVVVFFTELDFFLFPVKTEQAAEPNIVSCSSAGSHLHWTSYTWADKLRAVNPRCIIRDRSHPWSCPIPYPSCKAAVHTSPLPALRWGLSSPLLSSSYIKPSVLEWNGSLLLIDCVYGCPWNTLVVPKGCHFSISIPYNFISIWQLRTVCQVQEKKWVKKHVSETKRRAVKWWGAFCFN